jgi:glycosyltransferase involved in cell wall biosynthesis
MMIAAVIPAFNEGGHVGRVVESIPRDIVQDIIVVDDHSTDGTARESIQNGASHIATCNSHGVGAAIKAGYAEALRRGADVILVLAADGQHDAREIPVILAPLISGSADYVVGDRLSNCSPFNGMRPLRFIGNHLLTTLTRLITRIDVKDSQCGFTAVTRRAAETFDYQWLSDSWGVPNDFLVECARLGMRVKFIPVSALMGWRRSYIHIHSYIPRMAFVLLRGALRLKNARSKRWLTGS